MNARINERILVACIALSCAPTRIAAPITPQCITRCGMAAPGNCAELQALEDKTVRVFGRLRDWGGPAVVCSALRGWTLRPHAARVSDEVACGRGAWALSAGFCVRGYTHQGAMEVELPDTDWAAGALAHELVHVLDVTMLGKAGHCNWEARGIKTALLEAQGRPDESAQEASCP